MESLIHRGRDGELVELHQEIVFLVDAERAGVAAERVEIFDVEMEIATGSDSEAVPEAGGEFVAGGTDALVLEGVIGAGMRRADDVGDAVSDGVLGHGQGVVESFGTVIKTRKDVGMKIDHCLQYGAKDGRSGQKLKVQS